MCVVENFSPGTIARLGFGYDVVKELNPRIIMCSISALGQTGPLSSCAWVRLHRASLRWRHLYDWRPRWGSFLSDVRNW